MKHLFTLLFVWNWPIHLTYIEDLEQPKSYNITIGLRQPNSKRLETGATVSSSFTKTIFYNFSGNDDLSKVSKLTYVFPNDSFVKGKSINDYLVE